MLRVLISALLGAIGVGAALAQEDSPTLEAALERLNGVIGDAPSRLHHQRAEVYFRLGRFDEAIADYDAAAEFGWPHDEASCWERGLAQYYAGGYQDGAEQFARYHEVGPLDIENGLWRFLCIAEVGGLENARESMLAYPRRVRPPFPALLDLFLGEGSAEAVLKEAESANRSDEERAVDLFNAHYYLGKYFEITGEHEKALEHVREALTHPYAHFMYACAEIDLARLESKSPPETNDESN